MSPPVVFGRYRTGWTDAHLALQRAQARGRDAVTLRGLGDTREVPLDSGPEAFYTRTLEALWRLSTSQKIERALARTQGGRAFEPPDGDPSPKQVGELDMASRCERAWYRLGAPEFRVHPGMLDALGRTRIDVDCKHLRWPFPVFEVRFPTGNELGVEGVLASQIVFDEQDPSGDRIGGEPAVPVDVQVRNQPKSDQGRVRMALAVFASLTGETAAQGGLLYVLTLRDGQTLSQRVDAIYERANAARGAPGPTSEDESAGGREGFWRTVMKVVVGVSFLAIGRDRVKREPGEVQLVEPIPVPREERRREAKARGVKTKTVARESLRFDVGRQVGLLPKYEGAGSAPGSGGTAEERARRELTRGHVRCGHLRWTAVGPRNPGPGERNDYELRWVSPAIVRPDLPMGPARPQEVREPRGSVVSLDLASVQEEGGGTAAGGST